VLISRKRVYLLWLYPEGPSTPTLGNERSADGHANGRSSASGWSRWASEVDRSAPTVICSHVDQIAGCTGCSKTPPRAWNRRRLGHVVPPLRQSFRTSR